MQAKVVKIFEKKELFWKFAILMIFLLAFIFFFEAWRDLTSLILFLVGYFVAIFLLVLDAKYFYPFYQDQIEESVQNISQQNAENNQENLQNQSSQLPFIISRSFYFLLVLPFLSIYALTSTGSPLAISFVMATNLFLIIEMLELRKEYLVFSDRFFRNLERPLSKKEVNRICIGVVIYFLFLLVVWIF
jgi:c-di-AMP phosphodiesterase-like protein